jgi:hypothetical protein
VLNSFEIPEPLGLHWNRKCKNCTIQVGLFTNSKTLLDTIPTGLNK